MQYEKTLLLLLAVCILAKQAEADLCEKNTSLSELPHGLLRELSNMLLKGKKVIFRGCFENRFVRKEDVRFLLYTRKNPIESHLLDPNNPYQINPDKPIIILVPGWLCNVSNDRMPELKNAYLQRYDCNLIGIDWTAISIDYYASAICNAKGVAKIIGAFLCNLQDALKISLEEVHLVGQSMGAQLAGLVGQEVQNQCGCILGRITGLDPAGPIYNHRPASERLDKSDALFVDVIHTNMGFLGYVGSCGTVDFYPYSGSYQPGCNELTQLPNIVKLSLQSILCSHLRSADYMVESIMYAKFLGSPCLRLSLICVYSIFSKKDENLAMGEDCPKNLPYRNYYVWSKNYIS